MYGHRLTQGKRREGDLLSDCRVQGVTATALTPTVTLQLDSLNWHKFCQSFLHNLYVPLEIAHSVKRFILFRVKIKIKQWPLKSINKQGNTGRQ